jgi:hypothetical protein
MNIESSRLPQGASNIAAESTATSPITAKPKQTREQELHAVTQELQKSTTAAAATPPAAAPLATFDNMRSQLFGDDWRSNPEAAILSNSQEMRLSRLSALILHAP